MKLLNLLEWVGAAAITAVPFTLQTGFAAYVALFALACMFPKAWHFKAWGLTLSYSIGFAGWAWSLLQ